MHKEAHAPYVAEEVSERRVQVIASPIQKVVAVLETVSRNIPEAGFQATQHTWTHVVLDPRRRCPMTAPIQNVLSQQVQKRTGFLGLGLDTECCDAGPTASAAAWTQSLATHKNKWSELEQCSGVVEHSHRRDGTNLGGAGSTAQITYNTQSNLNHEEHRPTGAVVA